ncbi:helix-turn-helix domain-containing protein [Streptomyces sp. R302]|uniref:helix-turn-helix domain-containing protein n=1 Tax=unclassified Streptomyces TaxID=2593676 RepID=UPI00145E9FDE|nr:MULTISPECIES: helix-turn-helix transcriptional regulator [unclassified Streptomyces]NML50049.1 helix-turn-helix domain-containing protein [Streptomyces sp. R301]NML79040.1 helix-turn-helix domain-containing protein [Streptomyces sp. R302]
MSPQSVGRALRALRESSGLTGDAVARRASMSAGKLSKIENEKVRPSVQDVDLILTALGVSDAVKSEFLTAARAEATEATAWRLLRRMGPWKHQNTIKAIEASTETLRLFQGQLIPGLLQTPEYMNAVFSLPPALPEETRGRTVAARIERQAVLHEPGRAFRFLICEHVLRWLISEPTILALQLDRLVSVSRLPNVSMGLVPAGARMPDFPMTCFSLHDDRLVIVETFHSEITTTDPKDVQLYSETFDRFAAVALYGDPMRALVERVRDELLRQQESL